MWTVVYMTQDRENSLQIMKILEDNEIITKIRTLKKSDESYCYEILVPSTEVDKSHEMIFAAEL